MIIQYPSSYQVLIFKKNINLFGCTSSWLWHVTSQLWHVGSSFLTREGLKPGPLQATCSTDRRGGGVGGG